MLTALTGHGEVLNIVHEDGHYDLREASYYVSLISKL